MKLKVILGASVLSIIFIFTGQAQQDNFPVLKGPYLGQKPPGVTPEIFAPGIISTEERYELNSVFSQKGDEFYYEISTTTQAEKEQGKYFYIIMVSRMKNGVWIKPEIAPFSGKYSIMDMNFSPDGNRLYFCSDRPNPWDSSSKTHIWYVDRLDNGWSEAKILGPPIYSPECEQGQPTFTKDGTMYFRQNPHGSFDLYCSKYENGKYLKPVILGEAINTPYDEGKPFIAPDESYLLFIRYGMPDSIDGGRGLYISFKREEGHWTPAKNTNIYGSLPKFTPDGKYFFFSQGGDIYWVDAKIIEELKPSSLK
jgi:Tol biopolymer transport system component